MILENIGLLKKKEDRPNTIIQICHFIDDNGISLAFNINSGNTKLIHRILENKIEEF